jgi:hypothetical protein
MPEFIRAQRLLRPSRKKQIVLEIEDSIDLLQELQTVFDLLLYLIAPAENVGVVLLESADSCEPRQRTTELVSVQDSEVRKSDRQLLVRMSLVLEYQAMPWAIHWLQSLCLNFVPILILK